MWCKILWNVVSLTRLRAGRILVLRSDIQWLYRDITRETNDYTGWGAFRCLAHSNWCNSKWFYHTLFLSYLELHKGYLAVGMTEGRYCPGEDNKSWVPRESHPGNFAMFSKIFQKVSPDGLKIYEQVSTTLCTVLTLNSPRRGDS